MANQSILRFTACDSMCSVLPLKKITCLVDNSCQSDSDCVNPNVTEKMFCKRELGQCLGAGVFPEFHSPSDFLFQTCATLPHFCPMIFDPVCGCDGVVYSNLCSADSRGISVAQKGECCTYPPSFKSILGSHPPR